MGSGGKAAAEKGGAAAKPAAEKGKKPAAATAAVKEASSNGVFARLRPKPRCIFFVLFVAGCAWVLAFYEPCDVKGKKRDCGYSGISSMECRTTACFLKGGGGMVKKTVKVVREEGDSLGLTLADAGRSGKDAGAMRVNEVSEGAVKKHNAKFPSGSEDMVLPGDLISKIDGSSLAIQKAAAKTSGKTVELEIQRSRLPSFLQWIHATKGKPGFVERVLTSPGFLHFAASWWYTARIAAACWYISGYPPASIPMYLTISGAVAFQTARCCHDENVPGGVPHCFRSRREPMQVVLEKVWAQTRELAAKVQKDPRGYFEWLFVPGP